MSYLHSLSVFFVVAEEGSFTAAGKKLKITQPTVSFHIDNLEKNFGCPLFLRTAKGVELTVYGQRLYQNTNKINSLLEETRCQIQSLVAGNSGHISIGASTIPGEYILPVLIAEYMQAATGVTFSVETGNSQAILAGYKAGRFPIAVVGIKPEEVPAEPLWQDELVLVGHPTIAEQYNNFPLDSLPLILRRAPSGSRHTLVQALTQSGFNLANFNVILEVTGNQALKTAALNRTGLCFISRWAIQQELADNRLSIMPVAGLELSRTFYALHNKALMPTAVHRFWEYLRQEKMLSIM